jgi:hypothetical protein
VGIVDNQWLFNHEILMFTTPTRHALRKLLDKVANEFTDAFSSLPSDEPASMSLNERLKGLIANVKAARGAVYNGMERINDALDNKELGVLKKLAVQPDTSPKPAVVPVGGQGGGAATDAT